jgi:uncharacterized membrane protein YphA (DoxX/SURF4 family)
MIDPILSVAPALVLACVFLAAGAHKWRDLRRFETTLDAYRLLPGRLAHAVGLVLPLAESAIALGLLLPVTRPSAAWAGAVLLGTYTLAIGINLARGRRSIDCGCGNPGLNQSLTEWLLLRNGALIGLAVLAATPVLDRATGWLDWLVALLAATTVVLLYSACNQLLANRDRLVNLRPAHG